MLTIRPAQSDDLTAVLAVMDDASAWLQSIGRGEQWAPTFSGAPHWVRTFSEWIERSVVFVAEAEPGIIGVFRLEESAGRNMEFWPENDQPALYLFSLGLLRSAAGSGVGLEMLDWALAKARAEGKVLRLDCWGENERLVRYYLDAGFTSKGWIPQQTRDGRPYHMALFEKR